MTPQDAIVKAAQEAGIDPATALAIAQRESDFNVRGTAPGSSAYGLFQLLKSERSAYGGNSTDPYEQATAWTHYIAGTRAEMERRLGRPVTGPELYLGHYFGGGRAARMVSGQIPGETPVSAVFSPNELSANPNIRRAGTTGTLSASILNDIRRREAHFGGSPGPAYNGQGQGGDDFSQWGAIAQAPGSNSQTASSAPGEDFSKWGTIAQAPGSDDFSKFGTLAKKSAQQGGTNTNVQKVSGAPSDDFSKLTSTAPSEDDLGRFGDGVGQPPARDDLDPSKAENDIGIKALQGAVQQRNQAMQPNQDPDTKYMNEQNELSGFGKPVEQGA